MRRRRYNQVLRDLSVGVLASGIWVSFSYVLGRPIHASAVFAASLAFVFILAIVTLRLTRSQRRARRLLVRFASEPSASRAGDVVLDVLDHLVATGQVDVTDMADLAQRRRHPVSRILDGIDVLVDRLGGDLQVGNAQSEIEQHIGVVRTEKKASRDRSVGRSAQHLEHVLGRNSMLLLYGYSTIVCDAICRMRTTVPVFVVRDAQYGARSSLGEHSIVLSRLGKRGIEATLIDIDQISTLLDPESHRLRSHEGPTIPLPDRREVVAVIGCEAADRSGRVLIPATVRSQPSETAWFVAEFARARQRGQGASIGARLIVVGESFKVFDDLGSRPELRTTTAPVAVSLPRRLAYTLAAVELPRGVPVELVEIGPDHIDTYVDDVVAIQTRSGSLRLDPSCDSWERRVGIVRASVAVTPGDVDELLRDCGLICIDFNGVLVDDEVDHYCAFAALSRSTVDRSLPIDVYLTACAGRTDAEGIEGLRSLDFAAGETDQLLVEKQRYYQQHAIPVGDTHRARLHRLLIRLAEVAPLALVTASDRASVAAALGDERIIDEHFEADRALFEIGSVDRIAVISDVAREHGLRNNRQCLVIDDSDRNLAELRRRGYRTLGVSGLVSNRALPADVVIKDLVELSYLLEVEQPRG